MSSFNKVKNSGKFSKKELKIIETKLTAWHSESNLGINIDPNIQIDCCIPDDPDMYEIMKFILNEKNINKRQFEDFENEYSKICWKFVLHGGVIKIKPSLLGRAVEKDSFIYFLIKHYLFNKAMAKDLIERLETKSHITPDEEEILISARGTWVTWNKNDPDDKPFEFVKLMKADEIRANLGLDMNYSGKSLLVFIYKYNNKYDLLKPTIADAGLFPYFQATPFGEASYGLTKPWFKSKLTKEFDLKPRPEAIHKPEAKLKYLQTVKIMH
ncbi:MAG: hypothetical protein JXA68_05800 [Ignavibacteriales bacterium]|nr:hypothetical protein [Ignavibacteriales bacterium]